MFHKAAIMCHDQRRNIKKSDRLSGIISAFGCCTLEGQKILQSIGKSIFPLVLMLIMPGHVILQQVVLLSKSTSAIKVRQELLQIL